MRAASHTLDQCPPPSWSKTVMSPDPDAEAKRAYLKRDWPDEFRDGGGCGFLDRHGEKRAIKRQIGGLRAAALVN
jgi:hypothetical protein